MGKYQCRYQGTPTTDQQEMIEHIRRGRIPFNLS